MQRFFFYGLRNAAAYISRPNQEEYSHFSSRPGHLLQNSGGAQMSVSHIVKAHHSLEGLVMQSPEAIFRKCLK